MGRGGGREGMARAPKKPSLECRPPAACSYASIPYMPDVVAIVYHILRTEVRSSRTSHCWGACRVTIAIVWAL